MCLFIDLVLRVFKAKGVLLFKARNNTQNYVSFCDDSQLSLSFFEVLRSSINRVRRSTRA